MAIDYNALAESVRKKAGGTDYSTLAESIRNKTTPFEAPETPTPLAPKEPSFFESLKAKLTPKSLLGKTSEFLQRTAPIGEAAGYTPFATLLAKGGAKIEGLFKGSAFSQLKEAEKREAGLEAKKIEKGLEGKTPEEMEIQGREDFGNLFEKFTPKQELASAGKLALDIYSVFNPSKLPILQKGGWSDAFKYAVRIAAPQEVLRGQALKEDIEVKDIAKDYAQGAMVSFLWDTAVGGIQAAGKAASNKLIKVVTNFVADSESKEKAFTESTKQKGWTETFKNIKSSFKNTVDDINDFVKDKDAEIDKLLITNRDERQIRIASSMDVSTDITLNSLLDPIVESRAEFAGAVAPLQDISIIKEEALKAIKKADKSLSGLTLDSELTIQQVNDLRQLIDRKLNDKDFAKMFVSLPDVKQNLMSTSESFANYVKNQVPGTTPIFDEMSSQLSLRNAMNIAIGKTERGGSNVTLNKLLLPLIAGTATGYSSGNLSTGTITGLVTLAILQKPELAFKSGLLIDQIVSSIGRELSSSEKEIINSLINKTQQEGQQQSIAK